MKDKRIILQFDIKKYLMTEYNFPVRRSPNGSLFSMKQNIFFPVVGKLRLK